jgi:hypothetical protein
MQKTRWVARGLVPTPLLARVIATPGWRGGGGRGQDDFLTLKISVPLIVDLVWNVAAGGTGGTSSTPSSTYLLPSLPTPFAYHYPFSFNTIDLPPSSPPPPPTSTPIVIFFSFSFLYISFSVPSVCFHSFQPSSILICFLSLLPLTV